ncbi:unnamed protein product, partial [Laminaria digitata]
AYLLGKLDPSYEPFCKWYGERSEDGDLENLLLWYQGLSIPVAFMVSHAHANQRAFFEASAATLPPRFHFHVIGDQMSTFRDACEVTHYKQMHRMGLERGSYKHLDLPASGTVERLGHRDTAAIMALYEHYPDHFFEPYQLETGLYFGVRDEDLGLVSIAGVHVISPNHDVAVIGNLVTHPSARGRGLATACTRAVLEEILERVSFVALNVQVNNEPAIRMYTNFGFEPNNVFFEGRCGE